MAKEYLEKLLAFVEEAAADLPRNMILECRHFFSGAALYAEERICVSLTPVGLAMKLPEETRDDLISREKAVPLRYFPEGPVKKEYALFPAGVAENRDRLHRYVKESIFYVLTLPRQKESRNDEGAA